MRALEFAPGEVAFWLMRASVHELQAAKAEETAKQQLSIIWPFVIAIDEELAKRDNN